MALALAAFAANVPDLDMLVSLLMFSDHKLLHGGVTHSFAFAALLAGIVWLVGHRRGSTPAIAVACFFLVASHVVVDWLTGPNWGLHPSHGIALFWPFSDTSFHAPLTLFKGVIHGNLLPGALYTALWELVVLGPITGVIILITRKTIPNSKLQPEDISNGMVKGYN
jgi:membrane-bound metal-dependent hydrolase YbcI (DUF457 family)